MALELDEVPLRIECYDVSNLQGTEVVASMVVFEDGLARKSEYRRFVIKGVDGQNDVASMHEVITRRFRRLLDEQARSELRPGDDEHGPMLVDPETGRPRKFAYAPGLVVVDGGPPQVAAAQRALDELGIDDIPVCGLAKRLEEVWLPGQEDPVDPARAPSEGLYLLQRIRDEAHRFAITHHRSRRSKSMVESLLDDVPGLGEVRRKTLLKHFGSLKKLREAEVDDIAQVPGIGTRTADRDQGCGGWPRRPALVRLSPCQHRHGRDRRRVRHPRTPRALPGELVVVTGMTGAGRSTAAKELEDLGYYVIDNLPPQLLKDVIRLVDESRGPAQPIAVVIDVRSGAFFDSLAANLAAAARPAAHATLVFLEATDEVLVRRQEAARRPHPLQGDGRLLDGLAARARGARRPARRTPTWSSTPPHSTCTSSPTGSPTSSATPETVRLKVERGQLRLQVRHPGRRRLSWPTCGSCPTRTGSPSCGRAPAGTRRSADYVLEQSGAAEFLDAVGRPDRGGRRRLPARGQAVRPGRDRLHRRQAPQRDR